MEICCCRNLNPVYLVYDAFIPTKNVDWEYLFSLGLGEIRHEMVTRTHRPNSEIIEKTSREGEFIRRDITIKTEIGEVHEYYLGGLDNGVLDWRMDHFVKQPGDYKILQHALADNGRLRLLSEDIKQYNFSLDSLTPPPEGDLSTEEARSIWPDKFFWLHPPLNWFELPPDKLTANILEMATAAGPYKYCFEISEAVPQNWKVSIPAVLKALEQVADNYHSD